jgi:SET domain-containing protein
MKKRHKTNGKLVELRESKIQGCGVYALKNIKQGKRVIEYTGERITPEEETRRYDDETMDRHHTFLFAVDENTTIDAAVDGNEARFINHSCDPNCETINEDGHIFIEAMTFIKKGEELTYDYAYENDEPVNQELLDRYPCFCRARNCRGTILMIESENDDVLIN